ncbi:MAG: 16S rRNA (guanine(966)-N(2))-methyltransferase RsmD [Candidatus Omnitrophota bacterium]
MMKITGGQQKGRIIHAPKSMVRPTQNLLREAIFNILGSHFFEGTAVLDLFCGSGALGLEALSRGAKTVTFIDNNKESLLCVRENLAVFGDDGGKGSLLIKTDVFKKIPDFASKGDKFDFIFADPPYYKGLSKKCLQTLDEYDILASNAVILLEYFKKDDVNIETKNLILSDTRQYGDTNISFFRKRKK